MNGIEKQAAFYRGYLTHERSLVPLTIMLTSVVALWLFVYLVAAVAGPAQGGGGRAASVTFIRNPPAASSPIRRDASTRTFPCCCATEDNRARVMPNSHLTATRDAGAVAVAN
jgi:hypothetical protein